MRVGQKSLTFKILFMRHIETIESSELECMGEDNQFFMRHIKTIKSLELVKMIKSRWKLPVSSLNHFFFFKKSQPLILVASLSRVVKNKNLTFSSITLFSPNYI